MTPDTQPRTVPPPVHRAFLAWIAVVVCQCLTLLVDFLASPAGARSTFPMNAPGAYVAMVVFVLLSLVLIGFCAVRMRAGRNWARIVLLVIGALYLLTAPLLFVQVPHPYSAVLTVLNAAATVLAVVAVVLSFLSSANPYFRDT